MPSGVYERTIKPFPINGDNDPVFLSVVQLFEMCAQNNGDSGCEGCPLYKSCLKIFNRLSTKDNGNLTFDRGVMFAFEFVILRLNYVWKIVNEKH